MPTDTLTETFNHIVSFTYPHIEMREKYWSIFAIKLHTVIIIYRERKHTHIFTKYLYIPFKTISMMNIKIRCLNCFLLKFYVYFSFSEMNFKPENMTF